MHLVNKFILVLLAGIIISCKSGKVEKEANLISVSILPQKYFIERIAGNDFKVNVLIPPGASPATYEPTPMQMKDVAKSIAYFRIGYIPFETVWLDNLLEGTDNIKLIDLSKGIELIKGQEKHGDHFHEGGIDPHVWSSLKSVKILSENLCQELIKMVPEKKDVYEKNYLQFLSEIEELDQLAEDSFSKKKGMSFMIFHPALTYLARDYKLNQISVEMDGKEPSPTHMKHLVEEAQRLQIKHIFVQKQFNVENAKAIVAEINGDVVVIDPLAEDWLTEMKRIITILKD
ncbi:zinc ABC transporter substrate-binding protein [Labilibaculum sp. K2S]|uniref:metal ABC transporter solute-binding protein, Zn/Mn family n=1 Tax=Labilibaculum sp. K2S TaxID=3056386 RepID=UPI0025A433C4|nr:zinc ABC transporter substrate-binding protein [Labilibaculum sp. K2S]MDM8161663.1 zinc ABC transporter substrate-binding protein [Labilibaculum sp. K2S]